MASNIKFKRSAVQNRVPTTAQLELGELALNTYDGKLYTEINTGSAAVVEIGSKLSSLVVDGDNGGGNGDVVFHGATAGRDLTWDHSINRLHIADNADLAFGDGNDLIINHTGSHSFIQDAGSGNLNILSDSLYLQNTPGNKVYLKALANNQVDLYHNNNIRVTTTDDGADISGTGSLKLPVGTTAQRSGSPTAGDMRYNSTTGSFEGYTNGWGELGGAGIGIGSTSVNPGSGVVGHLVGVGYTTINFVGAGLSVTGYGTTIVVDIGNAVSRKYGRRIHSYTATANQTAFTGLSYTDGASQVSVYLNGAKLSAATYTATSGSTVVLGTGASVGDEVEILVIDSGVDISRTVHSFTATAGQTVFSGLGYEDGGDLDVYLNGIRLAQSDYTANNGTILTLAAGASVGDLLEIVDMGPGAQWKSGFGADTDDIYRMQGGVGIGTTNPTDKLNIVGNVEILGILTATTFSGVDTDKIEEGNTSVETVDTGSNGHIKFTTEGTEIVKITSDGKVYHTGGGNGRRYSFASDGSSHYMKYDSTLNGIILNGYGGITFETNGTNERVRIDSSGNLNVTGITTVGGNLIVTGNLQVDGTQTTVNSTTMTVDDKNIVLGSGAANDAAADGGGITLESGNGNKTFNWVDSTDAWTSSEHIHLGDNKKLLLGATSDLQIFHDQAGDRGDSGFNKIESVGSHLDIQCNNNVAITVPGANSGADTPIKMALFQPSNSVELYFNGNKKFETLNTGIKVTGSTYHQVDGQGVLIGASNDLFIYHDGSNSHINNDTGQLRTNSEWRWADNKKIYFGTGNDLAISHVSAESANYITSTNNVLYICGKTGQTAVQITPDGATDLRHSGSKKFETNQWGARVTGSLWTDGFYMDDNEKIYLGTGGSDFVMYHSGSENRIEISNGNFFIDAVTQNEIMFTHDSKYMIRMTPDSQVRLYHDGNQRLATTSTGVAIGGGATATGIVQIDQGTSGGNYFKIINDEISLLQGVNGTGDTYAREAFIGCTRVDSGSLPILRLAGQGGIKFCVDANTERLRITSGGSVNIGGDYTQTSKKFKVTGNATIDGGLLVTGLLEGGSGFSIANGNLTLPAYIYHDGDSDTYYGFSAANQFSVFTSGTERMRILNGGAVKIGDGTGADGGGLAIYGGTVNNSSGADATLYIQSETSSDWGFYLNKPGHEYGLRISTLNTATLALGIYDQNNNNKHQFKGNGDYIAGGQITSNGSMKVSGNLGIGQDPSGTYPLMISKNTRYLIGFRNTSADASYPWFTHDTVSSKSEMRIHFNGVADRFGVNEDGDVWATGSIDSQSDIKLKNNIVTIDNALDKVLKLRGVEYDRIDKDNQHEIGVIAQEVEKVIPELVHGEDIKTVSYGNITAVLIEAIKEQNEIINNMKKEIEELKGN